jgi:hypothetical protein
MNEQLGNDKIELVLHMKISESEREELVNLIISNKLFAERVTGWFNEMNSSNPSDYQKFKDRVIHSLDNEHDEREELEHLQNHKETPRDQPQSHISNSKPAVPDHGRPPLTPLSVQDPQALHDKSMSRVSENNLKKPSSEKSQISQGKSQISAVGNPAINQVIGSPNQNPHHSVGPGKNQPRQSLQNDRSMSDNPAQASGISQGKGHDNLVGTPGQGAHQLEPFTFTKPGLHHDSASVNKSVDELNRLINQRNSKEDHIPANIRPSTENFGDKKSSPDLIPYVLDKELPLPQQSNIHQSNVNKSKAQTGQANKENGSGSQLSIEIRSDPKVDMVQPKVNQKLFKPANLDDSFNDADFEVPGERSERQNYEKAKQQKSNEGPLKDKMMEPNSKPSSIGAKLSMEKQPTPQSATSVKPVQIHPEPNKVPSPAQAPKLMPEPLKSGYGQGGKPMVGIAEQKSFEVGRLSDPYGEFRVPEEASHEKLGIPHGELTGVQMNNKAIDIQRLEMLENSNDMMPQVPQSVKAVGLLPSQEGPIPNNGPNFDPALMDFKRYFEQQNRDKMGKIDEDPNEGESDDAFSKRRSAAQYPPGSKGSRGFLNESDFKNQSNVRQKESGYEIPREPDTVPYGISATSHGANPKFIGQNSTNFTGANPLEKPGHPFQGTTTYPVAFGTSTKVKDAITTGIFGRPPVDHEFLEEAYLPMSIQDMLMPAQNKNNGTQASSYKPQGPSFIKQNYPAEAVMGSMAAAQGQSSPAGFGVAQAANGIEALIEARMKTFENKYNVLQNEVQRLQSELDVARRNGGGAGINHLGGGDGNPRLNSEPAVKNTIQVANNMVVPPGMDNIIPSPVGGQQRHIFPTTTEVPIPTKLNHINTGEATPSGIVLKSRPGPAGQDEEKARLLKEVGYLRLVAEQATSSYNRYDPLIHKESISKDRDSELVQRIVDFAVGGNFKSMKPTTDLSGILREGADVTVEINMEQNLSLKDRQLFLKGKLSFVNRRSAILAGFVPNIHDDNGSRRWYNQVLGS